MFFEKYAIIGSMNLFGKGRTNMLTVLILGAFVVVVVRLFFMQIIDGKKYQTLANESQIKQFSIPAQRGVIYAMDGKNPIKLVMNETVYSLFIDPQVIDDKKRDEIISETKKIAGGNLIDDFEKLFEEKQSRYKVIAKNLNRTQAEEVKKRQFYGVGVVEESRRVYPEGNLAAQVLGFVNYEGGKYGVEEVFNEELSGKNGTLKTTTDVFGGRLGVRKEDVNIKPQDGKNLVLSIDRNVQAQAEKVLKKQMEEKGIKNGAVLVMNPESGKVMAMVNFPTYHPAEFSKVTDAKLFNNNTTTMPYENGSVIKSFTMAMGLNEGVASGEARYYNTDRVQVEDRAIFNAVRGHTGSITFQTAMDYSLNTGMVEIANRIGGGRITRSARDKIYDYFYNKFGFGQKTGLEIPESRGTIISPQEVEGNAVRYSNMTFGQGMDTTMIQAASGFSALVNGGRLYKPSVLAGEVGSNGDFVRKESEVRSEGVISKESSDQIKQILINARRSANIADLPDYQVGGKTGTSETLVDGKYVKNQTIGSYLGFGGNSQAKFVIMVAVWGDGQNLQGHSDAQPIFTEISNWMLHYLKINPKG